MEKRPAANWGHAFANVLGTSYPPSKRIASVCICGWAQRLSGALRLPPTAVPEARETRTATSERRVARPCRSPAFVMSWTDACGRRTRG